MSNHSVRRSREQVRAYMAEHQVNYTTALRVLTEQAAADDDSGGTAAPALPPVDDRFGGHEFEYERDTDLFRCTECGEYEAVAEAEDGTFTTCPGLPGWAGDPERVYLLVTENPAVYNVPWHISTAAREHGIGRGVRFGYRDGQLLVETAPSVADKLHRLLAGLAEVPSTATTPVSQLNRPGADRVPVAAAIERLSFEAGQAVIAANYAAYVAQYGDPDAPPAPITVTVHLTPDAAGDADDGDYFGDEYGDGSGWSDDDSDDVPAAACIRCGRTFAESDDYHRVAEYGPNSLLFIHTEDC
jgi:DNA-directed RNA polymerase subunit RPC12/RpoP